MKKIWCTGILYMRRIWYIGIPYLKKIWCTGVIFMLLSGIFSVSVKADTQEMQVLEPEEVSGFDDSEYVKIQNAVDDLLAENDFSVKDAIQRLKRGEDVLSFEYIKNLLCNALFSQFSTMRGVFIKVLLLVLVAALFFNFTSVFENGQIAEISFYLVYMLLFTILASTFKKVSQELLTSLGQLVDFMKAITPAYYLAIATSTGSTSAAMFYQFVLILLTGVNLILKGVLLPAVNIYVMLELVNHLSKEEFLSKLTELIKTVIEWGMKTMISAIVGLQIIKNLVAPAIDSLKRSMIGKTAGAIPGVGDAIDSVTEIVIGSAVLIRNCLGVTALIILLISAVWPMMSYLVLGLGYRLLAAMTQPISDKRILACLSTMGEGYGMLLKLYLSAQVMFMITLAVVAVAR